MSNAVVLPITGSVDPALLTGLVMLATNVTAAGDATEKTGKKAAESVPKWKEMYDAAGKAARNFNEMRATVGHVVSTITDSISSVAALSDEQDRLDRTAQRLGLDLDRAALAAGRFTDSSTTADVAARFAAAGIGITQSQLEALTRVAGSASVMLGTTATEEIHKLQEALIQGEAGGLRRFGTGLAAVAGESHTVAERFAVLEAQARTTAAATDTVADRMNRLKDSIEGAKRAGAQAFLLEIDRINSMGESTSTASGNLDDLTTNFRAFGSTAAYTLNQIGNFAGIVVGSVAMVVQQATTGVRQLLAVLQHPAALLNANDRRGLLRDLAGIEEGNAATRGFLADRVRGIANGGASLADRTTADAPPGATPAAAPGPAAEPSGWGGSAGIVAAPAPAARPGAAGGSTTSPFATRAQLAAAARERVAADIAQAAHEKGVLSAELQRRAAHGHAVAETQQQIDERRRASAIAAEQKQLVEEEAFQTLMARIPADAAAAAAAQFAQQAPARAESERQEEARRAAAETLRNKRDLEERLADHERYTGRLRETYAQQVSAAQTAAEGSSIAFGALASAFGGAVNAVAQEGATVGDAAQEMLAGVLSAIGKEASVKGAFYAAQGLGNLAVGNFAGAGAAFGASAGFFAVAGIAGYAAHEAKPDEKPKAAAPAGNGGARGSLSDRASNAGDGGGVVNINYYAPVIGGREATDAELGVRLGRFGDAARSRLRRSA